MSELTLREIKFRFGWNVLEDIEDWDGPREWVFEIYTLEELVGGVVPLGEAFSSYQSRDEYTGLRDKNGREIYERDIVRMDWPYEGVLSNVEWDDKGSGFTPFTKPGLGGYEWESMSGDDVEVIGNIYENPELMKGEK